MDNESFVQWFPFTRKAREYLKQTNLGTANIPPGALDKAKLLVQNAFFGSDNYDYLKSPYPEDCENNVVAFPVAKMLVSAMKTPNIAKRFCEYMRERTFSVLEEVSEKSNSWAESKIRDSKADRSIELADDLGIKYALVEVDPFLAKVSIGEYLKIHFVDSGSKLVNHMVAGGEVFLNIDAFILFISEKIYGVLFESLPIDAKDIPKEVAAAARDLDATLYSRERKDFDLRVAGKADTNLFPPCIQALYTSMLSGKKVNHFGRLTLASFLFQIGMPKSEIIALYAKSPDYDKRLTEYHVSRIFEKKLSAPGHKKIEEYGLDVAACKTECTGRHPVRYYLARLRERNLLRNAKGGPNVS